MKVSVVVPTFNSASTLEKCLASIKSNDTQYAYEIIVVDAGSSDGSVEIARKYADKVFIVETKPPRINRNLGVANADGDIVCFTDSDCLVPQNWIDCLTEGLLRLNERESQAVGVGGGNAPLLEDPSFMEMAIAKTMRSPLVSFKARNLATYGVEQEVIHNPPVNSAYFRWAINEVGGFQEEHGYGGEDLELDAKLNRQGYKLYYLPEITVLHGHPSTFTSFLKRMYRHGAARIRVGRKFRKYLGFRHLGPLFLCIMTFLPPLILIPLSMGLANGAYVSLRERKASSLSLVSLLTVAFYVSYGLGEISAIVRGKSWA
ncbi:MAG: glycosyltransferase [Chloroflexi bacterium]|nr:glycosyltransferase [Chloroflexota bacterium]